MGDRERGARRMQPAALGAAADPLGAGLAVEVGSLRAALRAAAGYALLLALTFSLSACESARLQPPPGETLPQGPYQFGEGDMIAVRVWKNPELSVEVPVRPDGMISVPLLNDVRAAGMTSDQLCAEISGKLEEYISGPNVTVILLQSAKRVYVQGEVQRPGPISLATQLSLLDAITAAGGFTPFADERDIRVIRRGADGQEVEYGFDYKAYIGGRAPGTNIALRPGDLVVVPQ